MSEPANKDTFAACRCGGDWKITAEPAVHDCTLLDVIAECESCGRTINNFINVTDCEVIEEGNQ